VRFSFSISRGSHSRSVCKTTAEPNEQLKRRVNTSQVAQPAMTREGTAVNIAKMPELLGALTCGRLRLCVPEYFRHYAAQTPMADDRLLSSG
jgi:hypothetical protein